MSQEEDLFAYDEDDAVRYIKCIAARVEGKIYP